MREFRSRNDSASKRVLNTLEAVKLVFRKVIVERVAIVEFGMHKSSGNSASS
jgi:hypothetical protein